MTVTKLALDGVLEITPRKISDERGFFSETFSIGAAEKAGLPLDWVQDNHSVSKPKGVLRGLHYQTPPMAQDKLVRVVRGSILDVAVDIRHGSPTFGKWVSLVVSAEKWNQILVPKGFAHGFLTLEPETEVIYKVTQAYSPQHDRAVRWNDPVIGIEWPLGGEVPKLSEKDNAAPLLKDQHTGFVFGKE